MMLITTEGKCSHLAGGFDEVKKALDGSFLNMLKLDKPSTMESETYTHMLIDEDGLSKQLEPNTVASLIAGVAFVGAVVLCCEGDID